MKRQSRLWQPMPWKIDACRTIQDLSTNKILWHCLNLYIKKCRIWKYHKPALKRWCIKQFDKNRVITGWNLFSVITLFLFYNASIDVKPYKAAVYWSISRFKFRPSRFNCCIWAIVIAAWSANRLGVHLGYRFQRMFLRHLRPTGAKGALFFLYSGKNGLFLSSNAVVGEESYG